MFPGPDSPTDGTGTGCDGFLPFRLGAKMPITMETVKDGDLVLYCGKDVSALAAGSI